MKSELSRRAISFGLAVISANAFWTATAANADDLAPQGCRVAERGCEPVSLRASPSGNDQDLRVFVIQSQDPAANLKIQNARQRLTDFQEEYESQYRAYWAASDQVELEGRRKNGCKKYFE